MTKDTLKVVVDKGIEGNFALCLHAFFNKKEEETQKFVNNNKDVAEKLFIVKYVFCARRWIS